MPGPRSHRVPAGQAFSAGRVSTRKGVKDAADLIAADARAIAGRWSARIPPSVHVSVSADGKSATITAGGGEAPMAATFEFGLNHPVFGRPDRTRREWTWVNQVSRSFMAAAADRQADKAADIIGDQWVSAWARARKFR